MPRKHGCFSCADLDGLGNRTTFNYDALNRLIETVDANSNRATSVYDAVGNQVASVDPLGRRTTFVYDELNRTVAVVDPLGNRATSVYDAASQQTVQVDPLGNRTSYSYDLSGRLEVVKNALSQLTTYSFDAVGNQISVINPASERATWVYDALNRVQATVDALGNRTTNTFDAAGNQVASTNPLSQISTFVYDALNRSIASVDALGNRTTTGYDAVSNVVTLTDPRNYTTTMAYDAVNRPVTVTDAMSRTWTSVYDAAGNRTVEIDPLSARTTFGFDVLNRQVTVIKPSTGAFLTAYNAASQVELTTDSLNQVTTFSYDGAGRQVAITDPRNYTTTSVYDAAGNETVLVDASGNRTSWTYDALNRQSKELDPQSGTTTYTYDLASRLSEVIDPTTRKKVFGYDAAGRVTTESWYAVGGALSQTQTFTYDNASRLTGAKDPDGTYTLAYDAAGRTARVDEPFSLVLTFTYDAAGNRTVVEDSKGGLQTSVYDAVGQLTSRKLHLTAADVRVDYTYTGRGEQETITRYSDLTGTTKMGLTTNTYDTTGRLTNLKHGNGSGTVLWEGTYTYDLADEMTAKVEDGTTTSYAYDSTYQLIKDGANATITYDATGNRTNAGYATGTGNRMTNDGTWTFTYDAAGNVTKKSKGASLETWNYAYDHNNQLTSAEKHATDGGTLQGKVEFAFDAFGNRLWRKEYNGVPTLTSEERFGYDGWDTAKPEAIGTENFDVWVDLNGSNAVTVRRMFGAGFDDILSYRPNKGFRWYATDHLGSVRNLVNGSGTIQGTLAYDAFGKITTSSGAMDRYGYTGREHDSFTGDIYLRARVYDPDTGRFMSADPIGFAAGDANLYRYVGNFVTGATDPSGLVEALGPMSFRGAAPAIPRPGGYYSSGSFWNFFNYLPPKMAWDIATQTWRDYRLSGQVAANNGQSGPSLFDVATNNLGVITYEGLVGMRDGSVIVANQLTFEQFDSLKSESDRLIAENGGLYVYSDVAGRVAREALFAAATLGIGSGIAWLGRGVCWVGTTGKIIQPHYCPV